MARDKNVYKDRRSAAAIKAHALSYPEAVEDFPWGHSAFKVKKKAFVFMGASEDGGISLSVKLPASRDAALGFDWAEPTGYGLGKAGWVSATFAPGADVPVDLLKDWIEESYRAVAPKTLVKRLDGGAPAKARAQGAKKSTKTGAKKARAPRAKKRTPAKRRAPAKQEPAQPAKRRSRKKQVAKVIATRAATTGVKAGAKAGLVAAGTAAVQTAALSAAGDVAKLAAAGAARKVIARSRARRKARGAPG